MDGGAGSQLAAVFDPLPPEELDAAAGAEEDEDEPSVDDDEDEDEEALSDEEAVARLSVR